MKKRLWIIILSAAILTFSAFFTTDIIRCKNDEPPVFCVRMAQYKDGGSVKWVGLFYNYYRVRTFNPEIDPTQPEIEGEIYLTDYVMTPWFFNLGYAKNKAFN